MTDSDIAVRHAPPRDEIIAWDRVMELRSEIGEEEFQEVVDLFVEEADAMIEDLAAAPEAELSERLHALKGCALNLGLAELAQHCAAGEAVVAQGGADTYSPVEVIGLYGRSRVAFLDGLQQRNI